jgi:hypothetical protein
MSIEFAGEHGGLLASAFGAGATACFGFMTMIGKLLGRGKDNEIAMLRRELELERTRCASMEKRLVARIQNLEGILLMSSPPYIKPAVEVEIATSAKRYEEEAASAE